MTFYWVAGEVFVSVGFAKGRKKIKHKRRKISSHYVYVFVCVFRREQKQFLIFYSGRQHTKTDFIFPVLNVSLGYFLFAMVCSSKLGSLGSQNRCTD
jgi:hypothetical protein